MEEFINIIWSIFNRSYPLINKEWEIYEILWNKMLYLDEGAKKKDMITHTEISQEYRVSHPCEEN